MKLLAARRPRCVLVVGATDSGKSALIDQIIRGWDPGLPLGVVDCDVGQSSLGPPSTVAWARREAASGWRGLTVAGMRFAGGFSPDGLAEPFLDAVSRMVRAAQTAAKRVIVDTTGLIGGNLGVFIKTKKVELIQPDMILAIRRGTELDALLTQLPGDRTVCLPCSPSAAVRSVDARAAYRNRQLARYFLNAKTAWFPLRSRLVGLGPEWPNGKVSLTPILADRLVALRTAEDEDVALGLLKDVDAAGGRLGILTPCREVERVATIVVGAVRWPSGDGSDA